MRFAGGNSSDISSLKHSLENRVAITIAEIFWNLEERKNELDYLDISFDSYGFCELAKSDAMIFAVNFRVIRFVRIETFGGSKFEEMGEIFIHSAWECNNMNKV